MKWWWFLIFFLIYFFVFSLSSASSRFCFQSCLMASHFFFAFSFSFSIGAKIMAYLGEGRVEFPDLCAKIGFFFRRTTSSKILWAWSGLFILPSTPQKRIIYMYLEIKINLWWLCSPESFVLLTKTAPACSKTFFTVLSASDKVNDCYITWRPVLKHLSFLVQPFPLSLAEKVPRGLRYQKDYCFFCCCLITKLAPMRQVFLQVLDVANFGFYIQ